MSICSLTLYLLHMFLYSIRNIFYSVWNIFYSIRNNYSKRNIPYGIIIPGGIFLYSIRNNYSKRNISLFHTEYYSKRNIPYGIFLYSIRNNYSKRNIFYSIRNIIPSGIFHTEYFFIPYGIFSLGKKGGRKMPSPLEIFSPLSDPIRLHALEYRAEPKR